MSASAQRSTKTGKQSLLFKDLASPISTQRGRFSTPGQAAAVSALWKENFGVADPPPPPLFTLDDRVEFSPEPSIVDYPTSPEFRSSGRDSPSPMRGKMINGSLEHTPNLSSMKGKMIHGSPEATSSYAMTPGSGWWSPPKEVINGVEKGRGSPVTGVVEVQQQTVALLTLPPPREVARPELQRNTVPVGDLAEEEWVTVFGFSPGDTNLVLQEFEKCGIILKHVPGPRDANWMHILYQNRFDAQKALAKNGMQINGLLIVGVKLLDPVQRQALSQKPINHAFMVVPPHSSSRSSTLSFLRASSRPYYLQSQDGNQRNAGAIASPSKSVVSKIMDLMFGI
ncbi:hypothetical protein AMTRI_Chr05g57890 [Amborella trichopoda]